VTQLNGEAPAGRPTASGPGTPKTILLVEDNDLNMKLFHDLLEMRGYIVLQARDGIEGLRLARQRRPDLIVMDIQLPGVSGLVVAKSIKDDASLKAIPIIAVTAFALKGDEVRIREHGCDAYFAKPIYAPDFLETVAQFLGIAHESRAIS
jgi:two-component system cell cycle response regulator DivK